MHDLEKHIRRVRRRLSLQRFLLYLGWCWSAALTAAVLASVVGKIWPHLALQTTPLVLGALGLGLLPAIGLWYRRRPTKTEAALVIDTAFDLPQRISSAVSLTPNPLHTNPPPPL